MISKFNSYCRFGALLALFRRVYSDSPALFRTIHIHSANCYCSFILITQNLFL